MKQIIKIIGTIMMLALMLTSIAAASTFNAVSFTTQNSKAVTFNGNAKISSTSFNSKITESSVTLKNGRNANLANIKVPTNTVYNLKYVMGGDDLSFKNVKIDSNHLSKRDDLSLTPGVKQLTFSIYSSKNYPAARTYVSLTDNFGKVADTLITKDFVTGNNAFNITFEVSDTIQEYELWMGTYESDVKEPMPVNTFFADLIVQNNKAVTMNVKSKTSFTPYNSRIIQPTVTIKENWDADLSNIKVPTEDDTYVDTDGIVHNLPVKTYPGSIQFVPEAEEDDNKFEIPNVDLTGRPVFVIDDDDDDETENIGIIEIPDWGHDFKPIYIGGDDETEDDGVEYVLGGEELSFKNVKIDQDQLSKRDNLILTPGVKQLTFNVYSSKNYAAARIYVSLTNNFGEVVDTHITKDFVAGNNAFNLTFEVLDTVQEYELWMGTYESDTKKPMPLNTFFADLIVEEEIIVTPTVNAEFTFSPETIYVGDVVQFDSSLSGSSEETESYMWDLNGDMHADSTEANPTTIFTVAGTYPVTLKVSILGNEFSDTVTKNVIVLETVSDNTTDDNSTDDTTGDDTTGDDSTDDNYTDDPFNHAPVLKSVSDKDVVAGKTIEFSLSATDVDGDELKFYKTSSRGTLNQYTGRFEWDTDNDDDGDYSITFGVVDEHGARDEITVDIEVKDSDDDDDDDYDDDSDYQSLYGSSSFSATGGSNEATTLVLNSAADVSNSELEFVETTNEMIPLKEKVCKVKFLWWCLWSEYVIKYVPLQSPVMNIAQTFSV